MHLLGLVLSVALFAQTTFAAEDLFVPHYKFSVGQKLIFEQRPVDTPERILSQTTIWVAKQFADGSVRMYVRSRGFDENNEPESWMQPKAIRIDSTGRIRKASNLPGYPVAASTFFPPLPRNRAQLRNGWAGQEHSQYGTYKANQLSLTLAELAAEARVEGPLQRAYERDYTLRFRHDRSNGLPIEVLLTTSYEGEKSTLKVAPISAEFVTATSMAQMDREMSAFFAIVEDYNDLLEQIQRSPEKSEELGAQGKAKLVGLLAEMQSDLAKEIVQDRIDNHDGVVEFTKKFGERLQKTFGMLTTSAPTWEAQTLNGSRTYRSSELEDKVLVLDFWAHWCRPCILSIPSLKKLHEKFKDQPVEFVGMHGSSEPEKAHDIVRRMEIPYENVQAKTIGRDFNIAAFPTLFVVDSAGTIREIKLGFHDDMVEKLSAIIENLLQEREIAKIKRISSRR